MAVDRTSDEFRSQRATLNRSVADNIARVGQHVWMVGGSRGLDCGFSYTVGNHKLGLPDLIIAGCSPNVGQLLNYFHHQMKTGALKIEDGVVDSDTLNLPVKYVLCAPWVKDECTIQAGGYYGHENYEVFQVVLSDRQGRFPGDPSYSPTDPRFRQQNYGAASSGQPWPALH